MFVFENCIFTCITDIWYGSYAGKIDVFFWELQFCQVKHQKTDKNESRGPPGRSKRLKKKQKIDQTPPGELGFGALTPFLSKKSVQRVKLPSPEDPKINENEVEKAVFLSHGPGNLFPNDFGWFGEARTLEFHAPMQVKHHIFKNRRFELRERFCMIFDHFWRQIWVQNTSKIDLEKWWKNSLEQVTSFFDPWKGQRSYERVKTN